MGLTLEIRANGARAAALERAWQSLSVSLGIGYEFDTARLVLAVPGGVVDLPPRARLEFEVRDGRGGDAVRVGHLFHSHAVSGSSRTGTVTITAGGVDPAGTLSRPRTQNWPGGPLSSFAEAVAARAGLEVVVDRALGRRLLAARPQIGQSDQAFLAGLVEPRGGRLVVQEDRLIVAAATEPTTFSGATLPAVVVDLARDGAWIDWRRDDRDVVQRAEASYTGSDGVTMGVTGAGTGAARRLPGTFGSAEEAAAAAARAVQDSQASQDSLDVTTGLMLDAQPLAALTLRGGAVAAGFTDELSIQAVRHDIGRRAATTTITARSVRTVVADPVPDDPAGAAPQPGGTGGGGGTATTGREPHDLRHIVQQVAAAHPDWLRNSSPAHGGTWDFLDAVVAALRREDGPRWGYNCKRGDCRNISHDAIAFYRGDGDAAGSTDVAIIDIIFASTGPDPRPSWQDQTRATAAAGSIGRWKYPR